ncbi:OX-2 membrane glycoprotein-like isoform X2 [Simochromis diagramma]|uniref:OX-2 membrane glycoprotein-like isoform X2 n=1 Tax=Simochromis diagramma TaxID=43689 RepID=UPI001A7E766E|nr:OX-2 membrane glycoprotein-like isoform X2 [Simochromis diagramma]
MRQFAVVAEPNARQRVSLNEVYMKCPFLEFHLMLLLFLFLEPLKKALTAVIQTQQTVLAAVGEDAEFSCQLLENKDVLQVTWQKVSQDVETNVATYNKYFGQRVNDGFTEKFKFKHTELQNCSIVIRNVTEQDEGCYHCLFNTYPEGSLTGRPCLQVYELHEPVVDVRESNSTEEWVVSCSATGRPAPTVTLSVSQQDLSFSQYNTVSVSNTNATFTVTTTAVLSGSHRHSTQVGCAARVLSAPHREVMVTIPHDDDDDDNDDYDDGRILVILSSVLLLLLACFTTLIFVWPKKKSQSRNQNTFSHVR